MTDTTNSPFRRPLEYDPDSEAYRARYDWRSPVALSTALIEAIAEIEEVDPREIGRLHTAVDPEALGALFDPTRIEGTRGEGTVSFAFEGYDVTVRGDGEIVIRRSGTE